MSLYNLINGMNAELSLIVSCVVGERLDENIPRFRNIFTGGDDAPFKDDEYDYLIYTRMGGGNYRHWSGCGEDDYECPFCELQKFEKRDTYVGGWNDEFDCTYRTLAFRFTPEQKELFERVKLEGVDVIKEQIISLFPKIAEKYELSK